jgi:hypothetical protein
LARKMISSEVNLIEGSREISRLRYDAGNPDDELYLVFRGVDSETDHLPLGEVRKRASQKHLRRADAEMDAYISAARDGILAACWKIIKAFS